MFRYNIFRNKPIQKTITDADFPAINPNDILTNVAHFWSIQSNDLSIGAYHSALSFLNNYVAEFYKCDYELAHMFEIEKFLAKINFRLPKVEILAEGPIDEPVLGFVFHQRKTNQNDFFRVQDKHLFPTKTLQKFISWASKSRTPKRLKTKFIS